MCRLLLVRSTKPFLVSKHLRHFSHICKSSKEYQGHGWGFFALKGKERYFYRNIKPIWDDDLEAFGETTHLLAHARSAYKDEGITIENNMPFEDKNYVFAFNGELQGVRIREEGRIGAEKIFNFIKRINQGDFLKALRQGTRIIAQRTRYIKAMNIIVSDGQSVYVSSSFNEDPDYFTLHYCLKPEDRSGEELIICSMPYPEEKNWQIFNNHEIRVF